MEASRRNEVEWPAPRRDDARDARPCILFVEPRQDALRALERLLKADAERWNLVFVETFQQAFGALAAAPADVVVASVDPANLDDVVALERLKDQHPMAVRMVFGAPALRENVVRVAPLCHQYLVKPFDVMRLHERLDRALAVRALLASPALRAAVGDTESLPSPPPVLIELRAAIDAPGTNAATVARVVEQDAALAAKLLQLANSAFFGTSRKYAAGTVVSIAEAVVLLGLATVEQLALITGLLVAFEGQEDALGMSPGTMQRHTTLVAEIAARLMTSRRFAEEAYVGGLLHDVGKLVLACRCPEVYRRVVPESRRRQLPAWRVENELFGTTHAEVGAYLLACWGLPRVVIEAVAHHHHPSSLGHTNFDPMGAVHVADALAHGLVGPANDPTRDEASLLDAAYLETTGITGRMPAFRKLARDLSKRG